MTFADRGSLSGDTLYAARGVWRLIRNDIRWSDDFELSGLGLIRSFFAQVVRLPFVVVFVLLVSRSTGASTSWPFVALACTFDLLGAMAYLLVAMITIRLLRLPGALGFVILNNWADLVFAIAAGVLCGMAHFVDPSLKAFRLFWFAIVVPLEIFCVWRAARAALGADISAAVLLVVLNVGIDVAADQLSAVVSIG